MTLGDIVKALEALDVLKTTPKDPTGHTYSAAAQCTRCGVAIPAKRQYTAVECAGKASSLDEYAVKRDALVATAPAAPAKTR